MYVSSTQAEKDEQKRESRERVDKSNNNNS